MIKLLNAKPVKAHMLELSFSDHTQGVFDGAAYIATRQGPLLEALREPAYFNRCFVDAGALCWPNGLELSAARLRELVRTDADKRGELRAVALSEVTAKHPHLLTPAVVTSK